MHILIEGPVRSEGAALIWMLVKNYKYTTLTKINQAMSNYAWPKYHNFGNLPEIRETWLEGEVDPNQPQSEPKARRPARDIHLKMSAGQLLIWLVHSVAVLSPLIADAVSAHGDPPCWRSWKLLVRVINVALSREVDEEWAQRLAALVLKHQHLVLSDELIQYRDIYKPKNHYMSHLAADGLKFGPLTGFWEFLFEAFHQFFKRSAERSNHINTIATLANEWAEASAAAYLRGDAFARCHARAVREPYFKEDVARSPNEHPATSMLYAFMGVLPTALSGKRPGGPASEPSVSVAWHNAVQHQGGTIGEGSWVRVSRPASSRGADALHQRLAKVAGIIEAEGLFFVALVLFPDDALQLSEDGELVSFDAGVYDDDPAAGGPARCIAIAADATATIDSLWKVSAPMGSSSLTVSVFFKHGF